MWKILIVFRVYLSCEINLHVFHWPYYSMLYNDSLIQLFFLSVSPASVAPHALRQQKE